MGDTVAVWTVPLSDKIHQIEFEHGTTTGKRVVRVDGKVGLFRAVISFRCFLLIKHLALRDAAHSFLRQLVLELQKIRCVPPVSHSFLPQEILRRDWMFKLVGTEAFEVGDAARCEIVINATCGFAYEYSLMVSKLLYVEAVIVTIVFLRLTENSSPNSRRSSQK